tara:strand:- start:311 stop:430 length:120 start_codon:yes stop_codon:yes gene_type:complete
MTTEEGRRGANSPLFLAFRCERGGGGLDLGIFRGIYRDI